MTRPPGTNQSHPSPEFDEIEFETEKEIENFLAERREHLVVKRKKKKFVLVATYTSIDEARDFIRGTNYLIWVCPSR